MDTMEIYAGKVVSKTLLVKPHQKDKVRTALIHLLTLSDLFVVLSYGIGRPTSNQNREILRLIITTYHYFYA